MSTTDRRANAKEGTLPIFPVRSNLEGGQKSLTDAGRVGLCHGTAKNFLMAL